jgi:hypothetical protein
VLYLESITLTTLHSQGRSAISVKSRRRDSSSPTPAEKCRYSRGNHFFKERPRTMSWSKKDTTNSYRSPVKMAMVNKEVPVLAFAPVEVDITCINLRHLVRHMSHILLADTSSSCTLSCRRLYVRAVLELQASKLPSVAQRYDPSLVAVMCCYRLPNFPLVCFTASNSTPYRW